jgi:uncharacterized membrane protein
LARVVYAGATLGIAFLNALFAAYASQKTWALFNAVGPVVVYSLLGTLLLVGGKLINRNHGRLRFSRSRISDPLPESG